MSIFELCLQRSQSDQSDEENVHQDNLWSDSTNSKTELEGVTNDSKLVSVINGTEAEISNSAVGDDCSLCRIYVFFPMIIYTKNVVQLEF